MNVTDENYQNEVLSADGLVVVDFWAEWCTPCKIQGPIIDELADKYKDNEKVKFVKLNTDENPQVAGGNQIFSIPTLMIYKNGEVVDKLVGLRSEEELQQKVDELL